MAPAASSQGAGVVGFAFRCKHMDWLPYQRRLIRAVETRRYATIAASWPRGAGKTTVAGWLVARALTPGDRLYVKGGEIVLFAGSIEQCRLVFRQALGFLEGRVREFRTVDSATRVAITRKECRTRLKAVGSNPKTSLGLVGVPLVILDEPGALHTVGGEALWASLATAQGKVGSPLRAVVIGTLAPAAPGSWWPALVERGTRGSTFVTCLQGRADRWSTWREIVRVNPLARHHAELADKLREERDNALEDSRLAATFKSFRLNLPAADEASVLVPVEDWESTLARPVAGPFGPPIVGLDLGGGRAWSAAVAVWRSGRVEALALAPGVPSLEAQERRDRQPFGIYRRLAKDGRLRLSEGVRVPPVADLVKAVGAQWGKPEVCFVDRFRLPELMDAAPGWRIIPRVSRWSESSEDIRALRKFCADGPMSIEAKSRGLLTASMGVAMTKTDDAGNVRMTKRGSHNQGRDDVAAALVLAAGALSRAPKPRRLRSVLAG